MPRTKLDIFMGTTAAPVHQSMGEITRVLGKGWGYVNKHGIRGPG